jgi:hypothetical protein
MLAEDGLAAWQGLDEFGHHSCGHMNLVLPVYRTLLP